MRLSDDKDLLLDMQKHPENYSDEQLEAMMDDLDREPDAEAAWQRLFERTAAGSVRPAARQGGGWRVAQRIAATFIAACSLGVFSIAGYRAFVGFRTVPQSEPKADTQPVRTQRFYYDVMDGDTIFRFENIRLDSILAIVGRHYGRTVVFKAAPPRSLRFYITCHTSQTLNDFVETMSMFDGFDIRQEFDTLFVETDKTKEDAR